MGKAAELIQEGMGSSVLQATVVAVRRLVEEEGMPPLASALLRLTAGSLASVLAQGEDFEQASGQVTCSLYFACSLCATMEQLQKNLADLTAKEEAAKVACERSACA